MASKKKPGNCRAFERNHLHIFIAANALVAPEAGTSKPRLYIDRTVRVK
jgi:hypothetical protein